MEDFDEKCRQKVHCSVCESGDSKTPYCVVCLKDYLKEHTDQPHWACMFCKNKFSTSYVIDTFPSSVVNGVFKRVQEKNLLQQQLSLLPSTDAALQEEKIRRQNKRKLEELKSLVAQKRREIRDLGDEIHDIETNGAPRPRREVPKDEFRLNTFSRCEKGDCRGFLHDHEGRLKCNACDGEFCKKCMVAVNAEGLHLVGDDLVKECDADAVATLRELKKDVRRCPEQSCGALISKVHGCDQMFCVMCKSSFNWRTGEKIKTTQLHNPHYLEWMRTRKTGEPLQRELADVPCGGMPTIRDFQQTVDSYLKKMERNTPAGYATVAISTIITNMNHNLDIETPRYRVSEQRTLTRNQNNRVLYMLKDIDEQKLGKLTHKNFKQDIMTAEFRDILVLVNETTSEILRRFINDVRHRTREREKDSAEASSSSSSIKKKYVEMCDALFVELEALRKYANEQLEKIGKSFNCVYPRYGSYFWFYTSANVNDPVALELADKVLVENAHCAIRDRDFEYLWHHKVPEATFSMLKKFGFTGKKKDDKGKLPMES